MRVGRNEPCPCGSGNKYKRCCGVSNGGGSFSGRAAEDPVNTWWFGYPNFKKTVYREFAGYFEEVLVPTGELCRNILEAANQKMNESGDSATWLQFVIFYLSVFIVQAHQEAILLVGHGLSSGAVKVLRGMFEALVVAKYLVQNPTEVEDYRDYHKVILWKRYQYLAKVEPQKAKREISQDRAKEISAEYEAVKHRFRNEHQWQQKKSVRKMAEEVGLGDMYDWFYCSASSLHHANMEGLHTNFLKWEKRGGKFQVIGPSLSGCRSALAVSDLLVFDALYALAACFDLSFSQRIGEIKKRSDKYTLRHQAGIGTGGVKPSTVDTTNP